MTTTNSNKSNETSEVNSAPVALKQTPVAEAATKVVSSLLPYQQRVVEELNELNERRAKLRNFLVNSDKSDMDEDEKSRMLYQSTLMATLAEVLQQRVDFFNIGVVVPYTADHSAEILYPAIKSAMETLDRIGEGVSQDVDEAYSTLHDAFWSETPAPKDAAKRRPELPEDY